MSTAIERLQTKYDRVLSCAAELLDALNQTGVRHVIEVTWPDESVPPRILVRPGTAEEIAVLDATDQPDLSTSRVLN